MFMDSDSFYYSLTYDLTNSVQRQSACEKTNLPLWRKVSGVWFCVFFFPFWRLPFNNVTSQVWTTYIICWDKVQQL